MDKQVELFSLDVRFLPLARGLIIQYVFPCFIQNREDFEEYLKTNGSWHKVDRDIILEATNTTLVKGIMQVKRES